MDKFLDTIEHYWTDHKKAVIVVAVWTDHKKAVIVVAVIVILAIIA